MNSIAHHVITNRSLFVNGFHDPETSPDFWGTIRLGEAKGVVLDMVRKLRDYPWSFYKGLMEQTKEKAPFDYKPMQEHTIFNSARREHLGFKRSGLSVPAKAQTAFLSVLVSGL